jgi:hypothetical protein
MEKIFVLRVLAYGKQRSAGILEEARHSRRLLTNPLDHCRPNGWGCSDPDVLICNRRVTDEARTRTLL